MLRALKWGRGCGELIGLVADELGWGVNPCVFLSTQHVVPGPRVWVPQGFCELKKAPSRLCFCIAPWLAWMSQVWTFWVGTRVLKSGMSSCWPSAAPGGVVASVFEIDVLPVSGWAWERIPSITPSGYMFKTGGSLRDVWEKETIKFLRLVARSCWDCSGKIREL